MSGFRISRNSCLKSFPQFVGIVAVLFDLIRVIVSLRLTDKLCHSVSELSVFCPFIT